MQKRYEELGGILHLRTPVRSISMDGNCTRGIVTADGAEHRSDYVISACDVSVLQNTFLGGKYPDKTFAVRFANPKTCRLSSAFLIALGVDGDLSPRPRNFFTDIQPIPGLDSLKQGIAFEHYAHEKSFAPAGKTAVVAKMNADCYDYLASLSAEDYRSIKDTIGKHCAERLAEVYPETAGKITVLDTVTPLTFEHWCGTYRGSFMSFPMAPGAGMFMYPGIVPGTKNLFVASQWVQSVGGLPTAAAAGRWAVQRVCRKERVRFSGE